ncbi:glycosyltransferase 87 family protein [Cnuibacter sp. UC19_7]|uniref:glycosyltransferase 87 family protein n=1 Tax=Cnuibacter sp. UC19_7 TaxID=3350166 RepID=UPI003672BE80
MTEPGRIARLRRSAVALAGSLAVAVVIGLMASRMQLFDGSQAPAFLVTTLLAWLLFGLAMALLRRVPDRAVPAVVLIGAVFVGGAALAGPPNTSTDSARYSWDGILQNAGVSPYAEVPAAEALAPYRTDWLFPTTRIFENGTLECAGLRIDNTRTVPGDLPLCTAINRPQVPTIYPPTAELYFAAVRAVVPVEAEYWPFQVGGLLVSLAVTVMLLLALRRRDARESARGGAGESSAGESTGERARGGAGESSAGESTGERWRSARWAAAWGWCPFVATEAVTNSHVDVLGAALALAGSLVVVSAVRRRRPGVVDATGRSTPGARERLRLLLGGILLGAAVATKLVPAIAMPPLLRVRGAWLMVIASLGAFAALYIPFVVQSGPGVLGYLPGYLGEEGYEDGSAFALISLVVPGPLAVVPAAILLAVTAVLCLRHADPAAPWVAQTVLIGTTLIVVSPRYGWYALLLIPFIVLSRRWEWFVVPLALSLDVIAQSVLFTRLSLLVAATVVLGGWTMRRALPDAFRPVSTS